MIQFQFFSKLKVLKIFKVCLLKYLVYSILKMILLNVFKRVTLESVLAKWYIA